MLDILDLLKTGAAVGGLIVSILSFRRAGHADSRAKSTEQQVVALTEEHVALKQQLVAILNKPRGGAGGQGGAGGRIISINSTIGNANTDGGRGGAGGGAGHLPPPTESKPSTPPQ